MRGLVETVRVDVGEPGGHRGQLGQLGAAGGAALEVRPDDGALVRGPRPQGVHAQLLPQGAVRLLLGHGSTPISSIASRSAFRP
ncbi:hypothetical protein JD78_02337 [Modestobacter roseus]|uniref:Uncharacterized protein n=1 Tax=Modestobacter roseus TaxID=1181884 RepID=A0A562ISV4_9ACTN|nr:hypothetical protein JD78_02337 [Modestobacter roseus]